MDYGTLPRKFVGCAPWVKKPEPRLVREIFVAYDRAWNHLRKVGRVVIFEGKIDLDAPAQEAWEFLIDIDKFSSCLPGIEEVKQIDDRTFEGVLAASVGPISGKFSFRSTIVESRPPEQMVVRTEGSDSVTRSTVNADMTVGLREISADRTEMDYRADIAIKGRLAILGDMVLRATATLILQEFTRRLRGRLSGHNRS